MLGRAVDRRDEPGASVALSADTTTHAVATADRRHQLAAVAEVLWAGVGMTVVLTGGERTCSSGR